MKNVALYLSGLIFLVMSIAQFLRYKLDITVIIGNNHHIPVELSLVASVVALILALWMFIAAITKNR